MSDDVLRRFVSDRYHIVRELGRGGMGVVYLGRDLRHDMDIAIKFRGVSHGDATLWLKREFRAVATLRHPNLVELYELVAHDGSCYFTMEYLPGRDPRRWVQLRHAAPAEPRTVGTEPTTHSAVPMQEANTAIGEPVMLPATGVFSRPVPAVDVGRIRSVLSQLAEGLAFLHGRGVIHRDIKPSNVIVVEGVVKLLDFGLAIERRRQADDVARENRIVGTAAYLAPEYVERLTVSPPMDLYALGVLGYELCTGSPPFGGTLHLLPRAARGPRPPRASQSNPEIPEELDELIAALLANEPGDRPTAHEVASRLTGSLPRPMHRALPFVGRDRELCQIARRFEAAAPRAHLIAITGSSGAGKSALIDEVIGRAPAGTVAWRGRCHERERVPYRAFDLIVDDLATQLTDDPTLAHAVDHVAAATRVFPVLAPLLDPLRGDEPEAADLRVERERALLALVELFARTVTAHGILVIDDLQWADQDSLDLLSLLVERVARPLTVLVSWTTPPVTAPATTPSAATGRMATVDPARSSAPLAELLERLGAAADLIDLPAMAPTELERLIVAIAPGVPGLRVAAAAELSAGSPYLAELIGRELADADIADPHDAEVRRLARLDREERVVAELTALAGRAASFDQLRALAELPSGRLQSVLRGLEDARIVRATPATTGDPGYVFYHQRLRETARVTMDAGDRRAAHQRFATWFERTDRDPAQLAYHWQEAGDWPRAARWAVAAADAARAQLAWGLAADWYARARVLGDRAAGTQARLAETLFLGGRLAAAADEFLALAHDGSVADRDRDLWRIRAAESYLKLGELDRGLRVLDDVLARHGAPRTPSRARSVLRASVVAARWLSPLPRRPRPSDVVLAAAYRVIASFLSTPYPIESLEYVVRGVALAARSGDRAAHAMGMAMVAAYVATGSLGRFGDRAIANARRLCAQSDAPYPMMVAAGASGMLATLRGNWSEMRQSHREAERVCTRLGLERSWEASFLRTYWGLGELYAGEPVRALELLSALTDTSEDLWTRAMLGSCRGRVLVLAGDIDGARQVARELENVAAARQGMASIYRQVFLGELALAEHGWARASGIAAELARSARSQWLSYMPAISAMIDVIAATAAIGEAVAGDRAAAKRAQTSARQLFRRGGASFYAPTALRLWAQAAHLLGDRAACRRLISRAAGVASERGGRVDRLAIQALTGMPTTPGALDRAVTWSTGGMIDGGHAWHLL